MRILIIGPIPAQFGSKNYGGVAAHTWLHARLMSDRGHAVTLLAVGSYLGKSFYEEGVHVVGVPTVSFFGAVSSFFYAVYISLLDKDFRVNAFRNRFLTKYKIRTVDLDKFDVLHVHSIHSQIHSLFRSSISPKKILTVHSYDDILKASCKYRDHLVKLHRSAKSWFDHVIHVSRADEGKSHMLGLCDPEAAVVYNPVAVANTIKKEKDIDVLFVGALTPRKRPDLLLAALSESLQNHSCVVVGDGPLASSLRRQYHLVASFVGFISHQDVLELMSRSRILCVPSVSESFGLVYVEAALKGAAVVGYKHTVNEISRVAGLSKEERRYFVGVDPDESCPKKLALSLFRLLNSSEEESNRVVSSLQKKFVDKFSGDVFVAELENIYCE